MADLWIGNVEADVSSEELSEFLGRYGFPPFDAIQYMPGSGERPAVVLTFENVDIEALRMLQPRIHNLYWKNRTIVVQVVPPRRDD
ncbi:RNA-binding protein [Paraburkholderia dinghuensis]|uniref:RNA-binding protein n=2 Tax=Paraburkholderia dinghuensis TaxID=2305225 RepID=A0A3N6N8E3_9BURK|nr:RNA-binding protein [Paraburkholderia dinghuensis]RQH07161.1 RNA-binding protein [Paraburkholderia dinghuensis]